MAENKGKLSTPLFRLSFPALWEPAAMPANPGEVPKKKYGLTMLYPKGTDLTSLKKLAYQACSDKWGPDRKKWPKQMATVDFKNFLSATGKDGFPFRDGDAQDYDGYEGMISVSARSDGRPIVVDAGRNPILEKDEVYPGCYGHAVVTAYAWQHPTGGPGVSFGLLAFMKAKDGEPFTRRYDPDDFAGVPNYDDMSEGADFMGDEDIPF